MLLRESQRAALPIGHLLSLADRLAEDLLCYFCEAGLGLGFIDFRKVRLGIDETFDVTEELHVRELFSKHVHI
jgi:hypothetical protein